MLVAKEDDYVFGVFHLVVLNAHQDLVKLLLVDALFADSLDRVRLLLEGLLQLVRTCKVKRLDEPLQISQILYLVACHSSLELHVQVLGGFALDGL